MPHPTPARPAVPVLVMPEMRVVLHAPVCPECGSGDVDEEKVSLGDGIEEMAWICNPCGTAWPLGCVCEWSR